MTSRRLSLTALSCALASASAGCTQGFSQASDGLKVSDGLRASDRLKGADEWRQASGLNLGLLRQRRSAGIQGLQTSGSETFSPEISDPFGLISPLRSARVEGFSLEGFISPVGASSDGAAVTATSSTAAGAVSASPANRQPESQTEHRTERHWTAGVTAGYGASVAEQTAVTDAEWNQVVSQWQGAIASLHKIPEDSPRYLNAQTKLAIYRSALERAEGRYIAVVQNRYNAVGLPEAVPPESSAIARSSSQDANTSNRGTFEADGQQVRRWIEAGNFGAVEQLLNEAVGSDRRTRSGLDYADAVLVSAVSQNNVAFTAQVFERLNQWVAQSPNSSMAYSVRSYFTQAYLWEDMAIEVGNRPKKCPPTEQDLERLGISARDVEAALQLDAQNPVALTSKLRLSKIGLLGEQAFEETFQALNAVSPGSFQAHLEKASYLWAKDRSGSGQQVLGFLRQSAAQAPANSALPMLLPVMHINIANVQANEREYLSQPAVWQEIQRQAEQVVTQLPQSVAYSELLAQLANTTGRNDLARRYRQIALNRSAHPVAELAWPKLMTSI